jgi:hypothetical protein
MTQPNHPSADCAEFYDVRALTAVETATTVRQSVALRIAELYPLSGDISAKLGALLARLDKPTDPQ